MHQSLATLDNPEFINLTPLDINPLMSSCEIKVLYVGKNRNGSFISKDVANDMAKTLRGAPIVGCYKKEKEDFRGHGHEVILDDEGITFNCKTIPYGFVSPDAKVWFQTFNDVDEFGNEVQREYLMTTGYLWTGQFEECASVVSGEGKNQSMELDDETLDGHWSFDEESRMDFFIINDATFTKLCILGDDVEPCFEGARVTAPEVSSSFSLNKEFKDTLFNMMQELSFALKGGTDKMHENEVTAEDSVVEASLEESTSVAEENSSDFAKEDDKKEESAKKEEKSTDKKDEESTDEKKQESDDKEDNKSADGEKDYVKASDDDDDDDDKDDKDDIKDTDDDDDDEKKKKYALQQEEIVELKTTLEEVTQQYALLKKEYDELIIEKKKEMIDKFSMLSDEDKADVVKNIDTYSLDDIEAKLSVIFARKQVKNDLESAEKNDYITKNDSVTFSIESEVDTPEWVKAVKANRNKDN